MQDCLIPPVAACMAGVLSPCASDYTCKEQVNIQQCLVALVSVIVIRLNVTYAVKLVGAKSWRQPCIKVRQPVLTWWRFSLSCLSSRIQTRRVTLDLFQLELPRTDDSKLSLTVFARQVLTMNLML